MAPQPPAPRKVVEHPIAGEDKAGALFLYGKPDSARIAVLCAGYPDDHEVFQAFASRLADEAGCLVGVTCLAGFDDRKERPYTANKLSGYSFDEMTGSLREAVKALRAESTNKDAKLIGIFHDWGMAPGTMYTNRTLEEGTEDLIPDRLVIFDVLAPPHPKATDVPTTRKDTFYETFVTLAYRAVFAAAFGLRRYISKFLAQAVFLSGMITLTVLGLGPSLDIDNKVFEQRQKKPPLDRFVYMAYPYYYALKSMVSGNLEQDFPGMSLPLDLARTPVLYMYGTEKRIMFHDRRSVAMLENENKKGGKSKVVVVEKAGHYLYVQQEDICMKEAVKFVTDA